MNGNKIICGDAVDILRTLPSKSVNCCITSPPYYGLRDYGVAGQIGREESPELYIARLVEVFREVKRVLRDDGTLWIVIADSYADWSYAKKIRFSSKHSIENVATHQEFRASIKPKDMIGIPWSLALALREDGWYLRSEVIWHKPNPVPESCRNRPTRSFEHVFLLSKDYHYYYDQDAVKEPIATGTTARRKRAVSGNHKYADAAIGQPLQTFNRPRLNKSGENMALPDTRNLRDVWSVSVKPYHGAHFAVFPTELITPCILAGCPAGGTVIDPFFGSGSTGVSAATLGRRYIGIDINPEYCALAEERLRGVMPADE
ncbi:MAG: site-specific DNA-methyltransferase [Clostridiales bacterium]|nr:site-specific DNA-methyltransferase [Clostridiales bacterium]